MSLCLGILDKNNINLNLLTALYSGFCMHHFDAGTLFTHGSVPKWGAQLALI